MDRILWLTADEIIHLTDRVRNEDRGTEDMQVCAYPLLLKLGSLFIEAVGSGKKLDGTLPIAVSEAECWLLRSKVTSMDKSSSDAMFGVKLCTKLYQALEAFQLDIDLPDANTDGETLTEDMVRALKRRAGG